MKIKIRNKQTAKWWGTDKDIIWAVQGGEDWWLLKPENKKAPSSEKGSKQKREPSSRPLITAVLLGVSSAIISVAAIYIWLLIKHG
jgi:hypothetical protein